MMFMNPTEQARVCRRHPTTPRATHDGQRQARGDVCRLCCIEEDAMQLSRMLGNASFEA